MSRLIDADDFVNRMYHEEVFKDSDMQRWDSGCWILYKLFEEVLRKQPTIEPERKKGKWKTAYLDHEAMGERPKVLYCSECNQCIAYPTHYCPNCGADMREGDAE